MAWTPVFSADFTGTNGNPWPASQFADDDNGTGFSQLDTNRGQLTAQQVPNDARQRVLVEGAPLVLSDTRAEFTLEIPHATGLTASVGYGFGVNLRTDGQWGPGGGGGAPHDPLNGYRFIAYRGDSAADEISVAIFSVVNGVATELPGGFVLANSPNVDAVNIRAEAAGTTIRLLVRDVNDGPLPDDVWDQEVIGNGDHASGQVSVSARGPTGGASPNRTGFIDNITIYGPSDPPPPAEVAVVLIGEGWTPLILNVPAGGVPAGATIFVDHIAALSNDPGLVNLCKDSKGNTYTKDFESDDGVGRWRAYVTTPLVEGDTITVGKFSTAGTNDPKVGVTYYVIGLADAPPFSVATETFNPATASGTVSTPAEGLALGYLGTNRDEAGSAITEDPLFTTAMRSATTNPTGANRTINIGYRVITGGSQNIAYGPASGAQSYRFNLATYTAAE